MRRNAERVLDEYLVISAQNGDRRALALIAERWQPKLFRYARRLCDTADEANDILQDAWYDILRGLGRLGDAAAFPAFAHLIVKRRAADAVRKAQRRRRTANAMEAESPVAETPDAEPKLAVRAAMATLVDGQRDVVALFYGQDLSVAEIAAVLGIPPGTVKTRLMHARARLKEILEGENSDERH